MWYAVTVMYFVSWSTLPWWSVGECWMFGTGTSQIVLRYGGFI